MDLDQLNTLILNGAPNTASGILEWMNEETTQRIPTNKATHWTKSLGDIFNPVLIQSLLSVVDSAGLTSYRKLLETPPQQGGGVDFGNPKAQITLDYLGENYSGTFTPEIISQLKGLGVQSGTNLSFAYPDLETPTLEEIQDLLDRQSSLDRIQRAYAYVYNTATNQTLTWDEIVVTFSGVE